MHVLPANIQARFLLAGRSFQHSTAFRITCRTLWARAGSIRVMPPGTAADAHMAAADLPPAAAAQTAADRSSTALYDALSVAQQQQVQRYLDELLEWNQHMNLTAVTDRQEAIQRHVCDSLALLPVIDSCLQQSSSSVTNTASIGQESEAASSSGRSIIDVGTGAGLPGMILAIARPHWQVVLLDSLQKRCKFLAHAAEAAGLRNVTVKWARAEDAGQDLELRQQFDVATARAVAETRLLAEFCLPLVRVGGHWVAAKGPSPQDEVQQAANAIGQLGGSKAAVLQVDSWSADGQRTAVVVQKARPTPPRFPRKPGVPAKRPL